MTTDLLIVSRQLLAASDELVELLQRHGDQPWEPVAKLLARLESLWQELRHKHADTTGPSSVAEEERLLLREICSRIAERNREIIEHLQRAQRRIAVEIKECQAAYKTTGCYRAPLGPGHSQLDHKV